MRCLARARSFRPASERSIVVRAHGRPAGRSKSQDPGVSRARASEPCIYLSLLLFFSPPSLRTVSAKLLVCSVQLRLDGRDADGWLM